MGDFMFGVLFGVALTYLFFDVIGLFDRPSPASPTAEEERK